MFVNFISSAKGLRLKGTLVLINLYNVYFFFIFKERNKFTNALFFPMFYQLNR